MKLQIRTLMTLLALIGCTLIAFGQTPLNYLDVRNFGAIGNGVNDDTAALQSAIDSACTGGNPTHHVYLPAGNFRVTNSLVVNGAAARNLKISGAGCQSLGVYAPTTLITWDGADGGTLLDVPSCMGLRLADLGLDGDRDNDGSNKAGVLLQVNSVLGFPSAQFNIERVTFRNAVKGILCGNNPNICNSDMTLVDAGFDNFEYAFHATGSQNVNFSFIRPCIGRTDVGLYFQQGGSVTCALLSGAQVGTGIKIAAGGTNNGNFVFDGIKLECYLWKGKRTTILDSAGYCQVSINGLNTASMDVNKDRVTPIFKLSGVSVLKVTSSMIWTQKLATITGASGSAPSWITFDECSFGYGPDPRVSITHDQYSGYELRNCFFGFGKIPNCTSATPAQVTPPPPTNVSATTVSASQINLTWTDVAGESGYSVDKAVDDGNGNWTYATTSLPADTTSYSCTGLSADTNYIFHVYSKLGNALSASVVVGAKTNP